jgi:membrane fusion protein, heavy metal efflux system
MNMIHQAPSQTGASPPPPADDPLGLPLSRKAEGVAGPAMPATVLAADGAGASLAAARAAVADAAPPGGAPTRPPRARRRSLLAGAVVLLALLAAGVAYLRQERVGTGVEAGRPAAAPSAAPGEFRMSEAEMRALRIEPVSLKTFRTERMADGRIALNEDRATPILSPYNGRVVRVHARVGDTVAAGDTLFEIETTDLAAAAGDLLSAADATNKARAALDQARREETRQNNLFAARAASQRDVEQARVATMTASADLRSAEATLAASRDKLRVLGRSAEQIRQIEETRRVDAVVPVTAPIGGTVTQRRVGPGQWLSTGSGGDPVFTIADLSTVWMVAAVRELDAPLMRVGQQAEVSVTALPDRRFDARIATVGAALDPGTRRLTVRAEVQDPDHLLKPEMFATFRIAVGEPRQGLAVPANAVIVRGADAYVWVAKEGNGFALHPIRKGVRAGDQVEVLEGLAPGERVVTGGALFIDRAARLD